MSSIELLRDVLMEDEKACRLFVDYIPNSSKVDISKKFPIMQVQHIRTERKLGWHPFLYDRQVCVINNPTEYKLKIAKTIEEKMEATIMRQWLATSVYANEKLDARPRLMTKEMFLKLPQFLKNEEGNYWIENNEMLCWIDCHKPDVSKVEKVAKIKDISDYSITMYEGGSSIKAKSIRVIIPLPLSIKVEMGNPDRDGSSIEKALRMI